MVCGFFFDVSVIFFMLIFYLILFEYSIDFVFGFINDYNKNKIWIFFVVLVFKVIVYWDNYI